MRTLFLLVGGVVYPRGKRKNKALGNEVEQIKASISLASYLGTTRKTMHCPMPNHDDKHPSCHIDHSKNLWHCKVCDEGGDILKLVMVRDGKDFKTALKELADKAGIKLEKPTPEAKQRWEKEERIQKAREYAVNYYHRYLLNHKGGIAYWNNRGISLDTIQKMKLGWSDGHLTKSVKNSKLDGLSIQDFIDAGLICEQKNKPGSHYDWFDIRAIFPMYAAGKIINISGRVTDYSNNREQKYKHLEGASNSYLYNQDAINYQEPILLLEGHPDTLTAVELGIPAVGVVGTSGLANPGRVALCPKIYICPDNDKPGKQAAEKWAIKILDYNKEAKVLFVTLPDGVNDFNDWALQYEKRSEIIDAFKKLTGKAKGFIEYKINQLETTDNLIDVWPIIQPLTPIDQEFYFKKIKEKLSNCGLTTIRKAFNDWHKEFKRMEESNGGFKHVLDVNFKDDIPFYMNVDFSNESLQGHMCLYGQVTRKNDQDDEITSREPILIRSTIAPETGSYKAEKVFLDDQPGWRRSKSIPMYSVVKERWSDQSIQKFLKGEYEIPNTGKLAEKLIKFFKTYIWYQEEANYDILAFYVMGTYVARVFDSFPYLAINGLKRTGKSNTLELMELLCFNAELAVNSSLAATFRMIESSFVTWIRDEAEQFNIKTPENTDELTLLNAGYKRGSVVNRIEKDENGRMELQGFNIFSPKVFGGINLLNSTLLDRAILIQSYRASKEMVKNMPRMNQERDKVRETGKQLRDELYVWALTKFYLVKDIFKNFPPSDKIINREWELWLPILSLGYLADHEIGNTTKNQKGFLSRIQSFASSMSDEKSEIEAEESTELRIIEAIVSLQESEQVKPILGHPHWYSVGEIAKSVTEFFQKEAGNSKNWPITSRKLTRTLKQASIIQERSKSIKQIKQGGKNQKCVYLPPATVKNAYLSLR